MPHLLIHAVWSHSQTLPRSGNGAGYSLAYNMFGILLCLCRFQLAESCYSNPSGCGHMCGGISAGGGDSGAGLETP